MTTTVEMNEQTVPLKSTEPTTGGGTSETPGTTAGEGGTAAPKSEKTKKSWFGGGKKKETTPKKLEEGEASEQTGEGAKGDKQDQIKGKKKCPFVCFRSTTASNVDAQNQQHQPGFGEVNIHHRDFHNLQTGIDLGFESIYAEPDSIHSFDGVWRSNQKIFVNVRSFFYKFLSLILFIPLAIVFGFLFALFSVLSVFLCVPLGRLLKIPGWWLFKFWSFFIGEFFDPLFKSIGHCFSNMKIARYGISNDPTVTMSVVSKLRISAV